MASQPPGFPYGMPLSSTGSVPLHLLRWPALPSPIPAWVMGSAPAPVYTAAVTTTPSATHTTAPSFTPPTAPTQGPSYGGMEGDSDDNQLNGAPNGHPAPPRYYKLEFPTFDGGVDPLNWLN